jgi:hypothetical protein
MSGSLVIFCKNMFVTMSRPPFTVLRSHTTIPSGHLCPAMVRIFRGRHHAAVRETGMYVKVNDHFWQQTEPAKVTKYGHKTIFMLRGVQIKLSR